MINLNSKVVINDGFSLKKNDEDILTSCILTNGIIDIPFTEHERYIFNHLHNYKLQEILIILQEFLNIDYDESVEFLNNFVNKLLKNNVITLVDAIYTNQIEENDIFIKKQEIEFILDDDGTAVIKKPDFNKMLYLNKTGVEVWNLINDNNTLAKIIKCFSEKYSLQYDDLKKDISETIIALLEKKFIEKNNFVSFGDNLCTI